MKATIRVSRFMRMPPPFPFVVAFLVGWGLQRLVPMTIHSPRFVAATHLVGIGLVVGGVLLMLSCIAIFRMARTTLVPFGTATNLITRGPYRFTRNPIYLSLTLIYLGMVGLLVQPWPLLLLPLPLVIINRIVIPFEEARLRTVFGDAFQQYCAKVGRWF